MTAATVPAFDVCGELPRGVTVLEASAGTGKTFTIAALAARYVAAGTPLERILLVTFTRMATGELRHRVRERFVSLERGLTRALAGPAHGGPGDGGPDEGGPGDDDPDGDDAHDDDPDDDDLVRLLASGPPDVVAMRRRRVADALADFDAATIDTTHGFCRHMLSGLGIAGDIEEDFEFADDDRELVNEVVDDLYVRKFHRDVPRSLDLAEARVIARKVAGNPDAALCPRGEPHDSDAAMRVRFAEAVRSEVDIRRRRAGVLTFNDLLTRLRDTLAHPVWGEAACERLRSRYELALVDEFQDTDPIQWEILQRAFGSGSSTLVLIGDPKQAIYSFRGADVYAYLQASSKATTQATLGVNWRSDQGLIDAFDSLFGGSNLGDEGIAYRTVRAAAEHRQPGISGAPAPAPLRLRMVHRSDGLARLTNRGFLVEDDARKLVVADLAADVVNLLSSPARVAAGSRAGRRLPVAVRPGHVAVLVRRNRDALAVRDALEAAGVPAVINGAGSVFATEMAKDWLRFLHALERPSASMPAHSAALTPFFGWSAQRVATATDDEWEQLHARLHRWASVLRGRGMASLIEAVTRSEGLPRRVLDQPDGERQLTDLRHIGQLLHATASAEQLGITALTGWLRQRILEAGEDAESEDRSRRLESDAEAVQVLTIYRSKGLEFPIVYCPFLWDPSWVSDEEPPVFHDPMAGNRRTIDVGGSSNDLVRHHQRALVEGRGEDLRLAYVALTRAQHQAVVWWAPSWKSRDSALGRLVFCKDASGNVAPCGGNEPPHDDMAWARFTELAQNSGGAISVERVVPVSPVTWTAQPPASMELTAGTFERRLDDLWRRTSYSGITSGAHDALVTSETEETVVIDEISPAPARPGSTSAGEPSPGVTVRSLMEDVAAGVETGTFVHSVLEAIDFAAPDLDTELSGAIARQQGRRSVDVGDAGALAAGLAAALETPLGDIAGDARLRDIGRPDRVNELGFELPLVGGDSPCAQLRTDQIGDLLRRFLPPDDVMAAYASRLEDPTLERHLRGYLSGSIDLVMRITGAGATPRFAVVDYKTNWLGAPGEDLTIWHYRPAALVAEMYRSHYPLQALLYMTALHRYLRWRVAGYSAASNLAGVLYLFVRGMAGPETPVMDGQRYGVFGWRPPAALVEALSDLLDRGSAPPPSVSTPAS